MAGANLIPEVVPEPIDARDVPEREPQQEDHYFVLNSPPRPTRRRIVEYEVEGNNEPETLRLEETDKEESSRND